MRGPAALRAALLQRRRRRGVAGSGAPRPRRADGYEFAELREYVPGDDPRRIDWAATARAGGLQTRVMYEDHALTLAGALDASRSMFVGRERTVYVGALDALTFWYGLAAHDDRCMRVCGDVLVADARRRGRSAAHLCAAPVDVPGVPFVSTLQTALATVPRDASLLVASDFYDLEEAGPLLKRLAERCDVTTLVVRDPWADALPLGGFVRLRDAESRKTARLFVGRRERAAYSLAVAERERDVVAKLESIGARAALLGEAPESALAQAFGLA